MADEQLGKLITTVEVRLDKMESGLRQAEAKAQASGTKMSASMEKMSKSFAFSKTADSLGKAAVVIGAIEGGVKAVNAAFDVGRGVVAGLSGDTEKMAGAMKGAVDTLAQIPIIGGAIGGVRDLILSVGDAISGASAMMEEATEKAAELDKKLKQIEKDRSAAQQRGNFFEGISDDMAKLDAQRRIGGAGSERARIEAERDAEIEAIERKFRERREAAEELFATASTGDRRSSSAKLAELEAAEIEQARTQAAQRMAEAEEKVQQARIAREEAAQEKLRKIEEQREAEIERMNEKRISAEQRLADTLSELREEQLRDEKRLLDAQLEQLERNFDQRLRSAQTAGERAAIEQLKALRRDALISSAPGKTPAPADAPGSGSAISDTFQTVLGTFRTFQGVGAGTEKKPATETTQEQIAKAARATVQVLNAMKGIMAQGGGGFG